ncbi:MAG: hypothetical protein IJB98_01810, partial [Clostridia bacterium]|nr:hypothetical protein [Clostridia bacterium]
MPSDNKPLPLSISSIYRSLQNDMLPEIGMPSGWNLTISQFLIKEPDENGNLKFTYIDESGKNEVIEEKYYYYDEESKDNKYVAREDLIVDLDGNYKYNNIDIKTELVAPSGIKFVSSISDIKGAHLVNHEPEELINIKSQLKQIDSNLKSYNDNIDFLKKQIFISCISKYKTTHDMFCQYLQLSDESSNNDSSNQNIKSILIDNITKKLMREPIRTLKDQSPDYIFNKNIENFFSNDDISNLLQEFEDLSRYKVELSTNYNLSENEPLSGYVSYAGTPIDINLYSSELSLKNQISQYNECLSLIKDLEEQKAKLEHQKLMYDLQVPVHYLYNDSGVIYGFGKTLDENNEKTNTYRLILITDSYENMITFSYKSPSSCKLESITDSEEKVVYFEYDEKTGFINNIIDSRNRKTTLVTNNGLLTEIIRPKTKTALLYEEKKSISIINNNSLGARFEINELYKVEKVINISKLNKVNTEGADLKDGIQEFENEYVKYSYINNRSTEISNSKGKKTTYLFDKYQKVKTMYENNFGEDNDTTPNCEDDNVFNSYIKEFRYKNDKKSLEITKNPYSFNFLESSSFDDSVKLACETKHSVEHTGLSFGSDFICGDSNIPTSYIVYHNHYTFNENRSITELSMDNNLLPKFFNESCHNLAVLCCWAKAQSAFIITDEETNQSYPDYVNNRKFELRVEIHYKDSENPSVYKKSFDWRNTNWQCCAVPVFIENKEINNINCFIDYSNNIGEIEFTKPELRLGDFEQTLFNDKGLKIETSTGHGEWKKLYEYDDNDRLIKETISRVVPIEGLTNNFETSYEYNKQGKLIKSIDYNKIVTETIYNDKGSVVKTLTYHIDEPANILCEETPVDDKGQTSYDVNEFGEKLCDYEYVDGTNIVKSQIDTSGNKTSYGYDQEDNLLETTSSSDGIDNT